MQAVDQQVTTVDKHGSSNAMAAFGMIVAAILIVAPSCRRDPRDAAPSGQSGHESHPQPRSPRRRLPLRASRAGFITRCRSERWQPSASLSTRSARAGRQSGPTRSARVSAAMAAPAVASNAFRSGERGEAPWASPQNASVGERGDGSLRPSPFERVRSGSAAAFGSALRTVRRWRDGSLSAVALQNAFRSGERGDPSTH